MYVTRISYADESGKRPQNNNRRRESQSGSSESGEEEIDIDSIKHTGSLKAYVERFDQIYPQLNHDEARDLFFFGLNKWTKRKSAQFTGLDTYEDLREWALQQHLQQTFIRNLKKKEARREKRYS